MTFNKDEYVSRKDHRAHAAGMPPDSRNQKWAQRPDKVSGVVSQPC